MCVKISKIVFSIALLISSGTVSCKSNNSDKDLVAIVVQQKISEQRNAKQEKLKEELRSQNSGIRILFVEDSDIPLIVDQ